MQQRRLRKHLARHPDGQTRPAAGVTSWRTLLSLAGNYLLLVAARRQGARALMAGIHSFSPIQALAARRIGLPVYVLQDGYLPINYPAPLFWQYLGSTMIWWGEPARKWGEGIGLHGAVVAAQFSHTASTPVGLVRPTTVARVLAAINHGGEWTSLISRCDVDLFANGVMESARRMPACEFRIRPHPTGCYHAHDGVNYVERLQQLIRESGLPNVRVSDQSLSADLAWAEFTVTEYSLAVLEYVAANSGGVAVFNPTGRRNFFIEFTEQGVPYAETVEELVALLQDGGTAGRSAFQSMLERKPIDIRSALEGAGLDDVGR
jgi:hypothetical protein